MSSPVMHSPLSGFNLARQERVMDLSCGVWGNEDTSSGYISLRGRAGDQAFVEGTSRVLGVALPVSPCTLSSGQGVKVLWLSPDEWMIVCGRDRRQELLGTLRSALAGTHSQVADNSGGYTQIILKGRYAADVLRHVSVYDLSALASGRVVGTTFAKSSAYLHRQGDGYCLLVRRSFSDYTWIMLVRAAEPYGFGIARLEPGEGLGSGGVA